MLLQELDSDLQQDLVDDEAINQAHNALKRYTYLSRSIRSLNGILKVAQKEAYIVLEKYKDRYTLPTDFIKCIKLQDISLQYTLNQFKNGNEIRKEIYRPRRYEIIEGAQRRIIFDSVIDHDPVTITIGKAYIAGDDYIDIYDADFENWFDPTVIRIDSNTQYMRISRVENLSELTGPSTISTVGTALTLTAGTFAGLLAVGDSITADGQTIEITAVDPLDNAATLASAFTDDLSTEAYTIVSEVFSVKRLWISENTLDSTTDTARAIDDTITLVDFIMDYNYNTPNYYQDGVGTLTTSSTAGTTSTAHGLKTGDYIFVTTNDPNAGELRRITVTAATTFTLASALSANVTTVSYQVLLGGDTPPLPVNFSEYIIDGAVIFAYKKEARLEEAIRLDAIWRAKLKSLEMEEFKELLESTTPGVNEMEMIGQSWKEDVII